MMRRTVLLAAIVLALPGGATAAEGDGVAPAEALSLSSMQDPGCAPPVVEREGLRLIVGPACLPDDAPGSSVSVPGAAVPVAIPGCELSGIDDRCEAWAADSYDGPGQANDFSGDGGLFNARTVVASPDGKTAYVVGTADVLPGATPVDYDQVTIAYDVETGAIRWTVLNPGPPGYTHALAQSVAVAPDGDAVYTLVYVTEPSVTCRTVAAAHDAATGEILWMHEVLSCLLISIEVSPDGSRVYVGGTGTARQDGVARSALFAAAIDAETGERVWEGTHTDFDGLGFTGMIMTTSPDGETVYVAGGEKRQDGSRKDFAVAAFDAVEDRDEDDERRPGDVLWAAQDPVSEPDGFFGNNGAVGIAASDDAVFIHGVDPVSGNLLESGESALLTYAHDAGTGERLWGRRFVSTDGEPASHFVLMEGTVAVAPDGGTVYVTGEATSHQGAMHGTSTVAYDAATGERRWAHESRDPYRFSSFIGFYPAIAATEDGVFVSSSRGNRNVSNYVTVGYDPASGEEQEWIARFGRSNGYATGIAATDDHVLVAGAAKPVEHCFIACPAFPVPNSYDIVTVAYEA